METNILFFVSCTESFKRRLNHGTWIDGTLSLMEIYREIDKIIKSSIFSENTDWRITEFATPVPYPFLTDQTSVEDLHNMAMLIESYGDIAAKLLARFEGDVIEAQDAIDDRYLGHFESEVNFVKEKMIEDAFVPEHMRAAFNLQMLWANWAKYFFSLPAKDGGVYIFDVSIKNTYAKMKEKAEQTKSKEKK